MTDPTASRLTEPPNNRNSGRGPRLGLFRSSCYQLLIGLVLVLVSAPFLQAFRLGPMIESILMVLVLFSAMLAVGGRHKTLVIGGILTLPAVVGHSIVHTHPDWIPAALASAAAILPLGFTVFILFRFVLRAKRVNTEVICASVSNYLMLGFIFGLAYKMAAELIPSAFTLSGAAGQPSSWPTFTYFYFSFITMCTVGYGEMVPNVAVTRMLTTLEAMVGTFYIAILVARLVAMHLMEDGRGENHPG